MFFLAATEKHFNQTISTGASTQGGAGPVEQAMDEGNVVYWIVQWYYFDLKEPFVAYPDEAPKRLQEMLEKQHDPRVEPEPTDFSMSHANDQDG